VRSGPRSFSFVIVQLPSISSHASPNSQQTAQRQQPVNESRVELKTWNRVSQEAAVMVAPTLRVSKVTWCFTPSQPLRLYRGETTLRS